MLTDWIPLTEWRTVPKVCGLYILRHRESGKEYVGKSIDIRERARNHHRAVGVIHLYHAIRKYGPAAFDICVYMVGEEMEMLALEVLLIEERDTYRNGYNMSVGGEGVIGCQVSPEKREAISRSLRGRAIPDDVREKIRKATLISASDRRGISRGPEFSTLLSAKLKGSMPKKVWTAEALARRSVANTGVKLRPRTDIQKLRKSLEMRGAGNPAHGLFGGEHPASKPVGVWWPDSLLPQVFDSVNDAAAYVGALRTTVSDWCHGKRKPRTGGAWAFL